MRLRVCFAIALLLALAARAVIAADGLSINTDVEAQPLKAQAKRLVEALEFLGQPLPTEQQQKLQAALGEKDDLAAVKGIQGALDSLCIAEVTINPESRVKAARGPVTARLTQHGWAVFLVKVQNEAGITAGLRATSPNSAPLYSRSTGSPAPKPTVKPEDVPDRWLELMTFDQQPLNKALSGLALEYRIVQLYSRVSGKREAKLVFDVGQGTQDLGFRSELNILFEIEPAVKVKLDVLDDDGAPAMASFVVKDLQGRVYPSRSRRLEPDLFFHDQVYRHDGEELLLPPGKYEVAYTRGPEYFILKKTIIVPDKEEHRESFRLKRWINLASEGWYSGDHHVHAAGCAHYEAPTEGVTPEAMMRHILGEDLNVGCVLSWGPCWYHQKQFFEGKPHKLSTAANLMRYDVEVSGFPSSHAGHLCLLRLKEDDYPGTEKIEQWPSWDLPVLQWGKEQGGVVGFSHSGWGLQVPGDELPNYNMPKFDGIGANEYVVDVVHDACDFISAVDTPIIWELSVWYHTLNCGYQCRISGETDFPCIYGEKVGLGRAYVKLPKDEKFNFDTWVSALKDGRSYCCDGLSHLRDFEVNGLGVGEKGTSGKNSVLGIKAGEKLSVKVNAAALLEEKPREDIRQKPLADKPYWHVERARVGNTNKVPVELIVNGQSVERKEIAGDGKSQELSFDYQPKQSCWVAVRIFPSSHTNPVFVEVDNQPIRASQRSAQWCLDAVDVCWKAKVNNIRANEREAAAKAYDVARDAYKKILATSFDDRAK